MTSEEWAERLGDDLISAELCGDPETQRSVAFYTGSAGGVQVDIEASSSDGSPVLVAADGSMAVQWDESVRQWRPTSEARPGQPQTSPGR